MLFYFGSPDPLDLLILFLSGAKTYRAPFASAGVFFVIMEPAILLNLLRLMMGDYR